MAARIPSRPFTPNLEARRPGVLATFDAVHEALSAREIKHALIGGLALSTMGVPRATADVDFLVDGDREDRDRRSRKG